MVGSQLLYFITNLVIFHAQVVVPEALCIVKEILSLSYSLMTCLSAGRRKLENVNHEEISNTHTHIMVYQDCKTIS